MSTLQKLTLTILSFIACALVGLVGYYGFETYRFYAARPLGPALALPEMTPIGSLPTWTASPGPAVVFLPASTLAPTLTTVTETPRAALSCGETGVMTVLAIGTDARSDSYNYGLADVIRVVRVDFALPRVAILEFPRDLWVEIPDIADDITQDHEKLNQAYLYGNPGFGYYDHPSAGPGLLALTLTQNFGVRPDHYGAVNMRTFEKIVNAVDGIDVTLAESVDGRTASDRSSRLYFKAGLNHLNGGQALTLARIRTDGVFERAEYQNIVLCALREKLTRPDVVTRIPELIASFQDNVQTDLSVEQLGHLACLGAQLRPENILFASFPEELFKQSRVYDPVFGKRVFVWDVDFEVLRDYVAHFAAGTWPVGGMQPEPEDASFQCP